MWFGLPLTEVRQSFKHYVGVWGLRLGRGKFGEGGGVQNEFRMTKWRGLK